MEAVDRFAVDDLEGAIFESNDVIGLIDNAADIGQMRVLWWPDGPEHWGLVDTHWSDYRRVV